MPRKFLRAFCRNYNIDGDFRKRQRHIGDGVITPAILYTQGQKRLYRMIDFMPLDDFLHKFRRVYETSRRIEGTALFLVKDVKEVPFYITQTMFFHGAIYDDNIFVSIIKRTTPLVS
jgi:K+ transporter